MVYCIAEFKAKEGRRDKLIKALKALEEETEKEKGCVQYLVTERVESQFATGRSVGDIAFNEIWETLEDFENHNKSNHIINFFEKECLQAEGSVKCWNVKLYER